MITLVVVMCNRTLQNDSITELMNDGLCHYESNSIEVNTIVKFNNVYALIHKAKAPRVSAGERG